MKIKRCPFCGSKKTLLADKKTGLDYGAFVFCDKCGASGAYGNTNKKAIKKWNRRFKE